MLKRTVALFAAVMMIMVVAACGDDDQGGASADGSTTTAPANGGDDNGNDVPASAACPAEAAGTLRLSNFQDIPSFDPQRSTTQQGATLFIVYDTLLSIDGHTWELEPWLASDWEQLDATTWRFELRSDVTFHDGSTFDADAVKLNLERGMGIEGSPSAHIFGLIEAVEVVSPTTVDVKLVNAAPNFAALMSGVAGIMISPEAIEAETDLTRSPAGSGGWIWEQGRHVEGSRHVFTANPDYWNPDAVRSETVEMHILVDPNARLNAFETGQIHVSATSGTTASTLEDDGFTIIRNYTNTASLMILDREGERVPAFADPRVREAMGLLINREAYNSVVLDGVGSWENGGFASPGSFFENEELDNYPSPDVERARELLADAGYPDGFSFQVGSVPVINPPNQAVAQMLAAGGIEMEIVEVEPSQYTAEVRRGSFPAAYLVPTSADIWLWWTRTLSPHGTFNPFGLDDLDDMEAQFNEAAALSDPDEQKAILDELQRESIDRGVIFALGQALSAVAFSPDLGGVDEMQMGPDDGISRPFNLCYLG